MKANYPGIATGYGVGFSVAGEGYVVMNPDTNGHNSLWQYDTASNKWSQKADFPGSPELGIVAFGLNNYGYVGLGVLSEYGTNAFYQYDPASDTWNKKEIIQERLPIMPPHLSSAIMRMSAQV